MRSLAMGGNGVSQTALINPAVLPLSGKRSLCLQYHNPYGLHQLSTISGYFHYPNRLLSAGVELASFGYDAYRESLFRLVTGKQLGQQWALGVSIQYTTLQTELYDERKSRLSTDIGLLFLPSGRWRLGISLLHTPAVSLGDKSADSRELTPFSGEAGFAWELTDGMTLLGSAVATRERVMIQTGIEYVLFDAFFLRAGLQTDPLLPAFGLGYTYSLFTVDIAAVSHPVLGMQTGIGLTLSF